MRPIDFWAEYIKLYDNEERLKFPVVNAMHVYTGPRIIQLKISRKYILYEIKIYKLQSESGRIKKK